MDGRPIYLDQDTAIKTEIDGSIVILKFSDVPIENIRENIIDILSSAYENRIQDTLLKSEQEQLSHDQPSYNRI